MNTFEELIEFRKFREKIEKELKNELGLRNDITLIIDPGIQQIIKNNPIEKDKIVKICEYINQFLKELTNNVKQILQKQFKNENIDYKTDTYIEITRECRDT